MKFQIFILFICQLLLSCDSSVKKKNILNGVEDNFEERNERQYSEALENLTARLHLPNLKNGVDSFEMRIWFPLSDYLEDIITIRYIYSQWQISETYVWLTYPERQINKYDTTNHLTEFIIDSSKFRIVAPKADINKFIDTLLHKFIVGFPRNSDFKGSIESAMDGSGVAFELYNNGKYKLLNYTCSGSIISKRALHNKMREFLNFLRYQLNEQIYYCN